MSEQFYKEKVHKPTEIENLQFVGNVIFWISTGLGAISIFSMFFGIRESMILPVFIVGIILIASGWMQQQLIHGFAAGLEQLFEIRKNTRPELPVE